MRDASNESRQRAKKYAADRAKVAKKAKAEFREFATVKEGRNHDATMRAIDYLVKRMGYNSALDQMPNWLLWHMLAFARLEVRRAAKS